MFSSCLRYWNRYIAYGGGLDGGGLGERIMKVLIHWIDDDGRFHVAQYDEVTFVKINQTPKEIAMMEYLTRGGDGTMKYVESVEIFRGNEERKVG